MKIVRIARDTYSADSGRILIQRSGDVWIVSDGDSTVEHATKHAAVAEVADRLAQRQVSS